MRSHRSWRCLALGIVSVLAITAARPVGAQQPGPGAPVDPPPLDYALFNQAGSLWLPGADFSGRDLYGADLAGANLRAANFDGATLARADLSAALLVLATLRDTDLTQANLQNATLSLADLRFANLPGADLSGAQMQGALLAEAKLVGVLLAGADLRESDLKRTSLRAADLSGALLAGANLLGADLTGADLSHADLSSANLAGANLAGANLDGVSYDTVTAWPANFDVEKMAVSGPLPPGEAGERPGAQELAITMTLMPALTDWFNQVARPGDTSLIDRAQEIGLLDEMTTGGKTVVFKSVDVAEQTVPHIADKFNIIGYNLEHGPLNPLHEQADPVGSVQRMRALADAYGLDLALGPDHNFALSHGAAMAPYVDSYAMQVQRVQSQPDVVHNFVVPMAEAVRAANPAIETSLQVRTEGSAEDIAALIDSVRDSIDSVAILSSPDTVETAKELVGLLREERARPGQAPVNPSVSAPEVTADDRLAVRPLMLGIALQFLVIIFIAIFFIVVGRATASRVRRPE